MRRFQAGERRRARWQAADRRRQPRYPLALPVRACGEVSGRLHDISRVGLCLIMEEPLEEGRTVTFDLVDGTTGLRCPFRARVVWCQCAVPGRAGLEFVEMTPAQDAWLASRFVDWVTSALEW